VPRAERDELVTTPRARHIVVQRGPRFYKVNVMTDSGPLPVEAIEAALRGILADSAGTPGSATWEKVSPAYASEPPVGALTGAPRDDWAAAR
ncbi:choline/carnitine O-acyltransferase, partial [Escherichia coli]|nr:choline/carnitine O-acyltransferase [Escherichia coli]